MNENFEYLFNKWIEFSYERKTYYIKLLGYTYTSEQPMYDGILIHQATKERFNKVWPSHAISRMTRDGAILLTEDESKSMDILYG